MKQTDYIVIQAHMVTNLKLSGNRLIIYALIHGYCKDGVHEFTGSINYISEWTNLTRNTIISTLKSLVDDGLIIKHEKVTNNVKFCSYTLGSVKNAPVVQNAEKGAIEGSANFTPNNTIGNNDSNKEENISFITTNKTEKDFIDKIYKMYPSICPVRNSRLGKCAKDKDRIRKLLKTYSQEDIVKVVEMEIAEKYGKRYMSNFSTFLNNFPDPNSLFAQEGEKQETNNNLFPKGYWQ